MKPLLKYIGASAAGIVLVGSLTGNVLLYKQVKSLKSDPNLMASRENDTLIAAARRLMVLPDETPTIATVTEPEKLKNQAFFVNAKKGDKVLIFTVAKKAVLYDPVANKIIETAPLSATNEAAASDNAAADGVSDSESSSTNPSAKKATDKTKAGTNVNASTRTDASE